MTASSADIPIAVSLKDELIRRGYTYSEWSLASQAFRQFVAPNGWKWITRKNYYDYPFIPSIVRLISKDKRLSNEFAARHSVNVPDSISTRELDTASSFLAQHGCVVVKPSDSSGGEGLTTDVTDAHDLAHAIERATIGKDEDPLIQRQIDGDEIRFTIIDGIVRSAIMRQTPRLYGDGIRTLRQLLAAENDTRRTLIFPRVTYPLLSETILATIGQSEDHVPARGEVVQLSRSTLMANGASYLGVLDEVHASYIAVARSLARNLFPALLVVDFIIEDITKPASDTNYIFLEFTTAPSTRMYGTLRSGDTPNIISMIADKIDAYSRQHNY